MSRRTRRPRAEASYGPELGTTYLLHFYDPATGRPARYKHAGHYIGWTKDLTARLDAHARGTGARLIQVITGAGLGFTLARTWPQTTRDHEDLLKHVGGGRRYCPECGVKPRQGPGPLPPVRKLPLYDLERAGTWLDGTPLPSNTPSWPLPAARRKDAEMFGRQRRAAARDYAERNAEADALYAEADRLDDLTRQPGGYRRQIITERATRIRCQLSEPLTRQANGAGPELADGELDAEIDRLAAVFPEPEPSGPQSGASAEAAEPVPDRAAAKAPTGIGPDTPDHTRSSADRAGADPETAHSGRQAAGAQQPGQCPLPRILPASDTSPVRAPMAATLPDGTPHADPFLAERGWQARDGVYVRHSQAQVEAG